MITAEKLKNHIIALEEKHKNISKEVDILQNTHGNELRLESLKKIKLHLKDEIAKHKNQIEEIENGKSNSGS